MTDTGRPKIPPIEDHLIETTPNLLPSQPIEPRQLTADDFTSYKRELNQRIAKKLEGKVMRDMMRRIDETTSKTKWKHTLEMLEASGVPVADIRTQLFPRGDKEISDLAQSLMSGVEEVIGVKPRNEGDAYTYRIRLGGKVLIISSKDLVMPMEFRRRWLEEHSELLEEIGNEDWVQVVNTWMKIKKEEEAPASPEDFVIEELLMRLSENKVTTNRDVAKIQRDYFFVEFDISKMPDEGEYVLLYHNHHLTQVINSLSVKTTIEKIHGLLRPYLAEQSKVMRVGGVLTRFWVFRKDFAEVDWRERVISAEEEKEEGVGGVTGV
jgi:hypothetical protein